MVKREKIVSTALTDEEFEKFTEAWLDAETISGKRMSVSQFLRDTILASINGDKPPSVPESKQEPKEIVSPAPEDTITKQAKSYEFNLD